MRTPSSSRASSRSERLVEASSGVLGVHAEAEACEVRRPRGGGELVHEARADSASALSVGDRNCELGRLVVDVAVPVVRLREQPEEPDSDHLAFALGDHPRSPARPQPS
jgi:hypothetical protein